MTNNNRSKNSASPVIINRHRNDRTASQKGQQSAPTASASNGARPLTPSAPRADRQRQAQQRTVMQNRPRNVNATTTTTQVPPPSKQMTTHSENGSTPSLLSRLATAPGSSSSASVSLPRGVSIPAKRRVEEDNEPAKRSTLQGSSDTDMDPVGGYSIKGAANRVAISSTSKESGQSAAKSSSLLDRMGGDDERRGKKRPKKT